MATASRKFLAPMDESGYAFEADKVDVDAEKGTTFVYNQNQSLTLRQQRQSLPSFKHREEVLYLLENYQTVVLCGETGSGKSTQIPQYLYETGYCTDKKLIAVTQPRRIAATTLAARVAQETNSKLGDIVGYSIRFDDLWTPGRTKIKFMTEGILVRELLADPLLKQYSVVMVDEVHERTLFTDVVMGLLRKVMKKRPDLRVIISSATMDAEELRKYFDLSDNTRTPPTAAILSLEGRSFPVRVYYSEEPVADYVKGSVDAVMAIHRKFPHAGDVLVFLTGVDEVDHAAELVEEQAKALELRKGKKEKLLDLVVVKMYGSLPAREQLRAFWRPPTGTRKVVIATNIAETSVTIPGIVHVVDCGFMKVRCFSAETQTDTLGIVPVPKASAIQRAGRAGRIKPGNVYRLYTEEAFEQLTDALPPEMVRADLSPVILQLKALGIRNVLRFLFPARPPAANMAAALEILYALGGLDDDGQLTDPLGVRMAEFPLPDPRLAKTLLVSGEMGCSSEICAIAAVAQVKSVFVGKGMKARQAKRNFEAAEGDLLTNLNAFLAFERIEDNRQARHRWCGQNYLDAKALTRAVEIRDQLLKLLKKFSIPIVSAKGDAQKILKCITAGYFANAVQMHHSGQYRTVRGGVEMKIHPSSVLYEIPKSPKWVVYTEVLHTTEVYMRDLTVIEQKWLLEVAPHYYKTDYLF